jgi:hypothetical protein
MNIREFISTFDDGTNFLVPVVIEDLKLKAFDMDITASATVDVVITKGQLLDYEGKKTIERTETIVKDGVPLIKISATEPFYGEVAKEEAVKAEAVNQSTDESAVAFTEDDANNAYESYLETRDKLKSLKKKGGLNKKQMEELQTAIEAVTAYEAIGSDDELTTWYEKFCLSEE